MSSGEEGSGGGGIPTAAFFSRQFLFLYAVVGLVLVGMLAGRLRSWLASLRESESLLGDLQKRRTKVHKRALAAVRTDVYNRVEAKLKQLVAYLQIAQSISFNVRHYQKKWKRRRPLVNHE